MKQTSLTVRIKRLFNMNCAKSSIPAYTTPAICLTEDWMGDKYPDCINDQGHYFKTCYTCFTMICRRCQYKSYDHVGSMTTTYGDFSGTTSPYDRYCDDCEVLLQRGREGWKCYADYEKHRIENKDFVCRTCSGKGYYIYPIDKGKKRICTHCEGTGLFPSSNRIIELDMPSTYMSDELLRDIKNKKQHL